MTDSGRSREYQAVATQESPDFESVYRDEFSFVYRLLRYLGAHDADIEDLAQDVFVVVHGRLGAYEPSRPIRPWLFGIAYRTVRRHKDKNARRAHLDSRHNDETSEAHTGTPQSEAWERLRQVLQELPYEQRAVVIMYDIEEYTAPEIAGELEVGVNTVYSRLRLGRKRLRSALAEGGRTNG